MSTSDVAICNRALNKLGADSIISLTDDNSRARAMNVAYEPVRRAEIRRHRWRFAIKRASLPALSATPISDFAYQYQVPNDFLRLIEGGDLQSIADISDYRTRSNAFYSLEGRVILCNVASPIKIRYLADITDAASFDTCFVETFACRLARETVAKITESTTKEQVLMADYKQSVREAEKANALEVAAESRPDSEWVLARNQ